MAERGPLRAAELRHYAPEARELIQRMTGAGWQGRLSSRGHAILRAPDGKTTAAVGPNYHRARAGRNAEATFRRWQKRQRATLSSATEHEEHRA